MIKIGILVISDRGASGQYEDLSGPLIAEILTQQTNWEVAQKAIIPDDFEKIVATLRIWCAEGLSCVLTSGGTGFAPRDITPEATRAVIEREAPGIVEAIRTASLKITKHAMLSRAVAGIRDRTLIINMPGNPKAVRENLEFLLPILPHALDLLRDSPDTEAQHRLV